MLLLLLGLLVPADSVKVGVIGAAGDTVLVSVRWGNVPQGPGYFRWDSTWVWLEEYPTAGIPDTLSGAWHPPTSGVDTLYVLRPGAGQSLTILGCARTYHSAGPHPQAMCSDTLVIPTDELSFPLIADGVTVDTIGPAVVHVALKEAYFYFDGTTGNVASTPDTAPLSIAGDMSMVVRVAIPNLTPAAQGTFIGKYYTAGNQRSYWFRINTDGTVAVLSSADGIVNLTATSTVSLTTVASNDQIIWLRVDRDVDDGAGNRVTKFFYSTNATSVLADVSWTQLGSTVTVSGTTSIFDSTAPLEVGQREGAQPFTGEMYRAIVYNGLFGAGTAVYDMAAANFTQGGNTLTETANSATVTLTGNSWTFVPTWNPTDFPILATARAFWFAGDGNGSYGPSSINPLAELIGNNYHLTRLGGVGFVAKSGSTPAHFDFDGVDDRLERPGDDAGLDYALADAQTIIVWLTVDALTGTDVILTKGDNAFANSAGYSILAASNVVQFKVSDGTTNTTTANTTPTIPSAGTYFVAVARRDRPNDEIDLLIDGTHGNDSPKTETITGSLDNTLPFTIGGQSTTTGGGRIDAKIAGVAVFRSLLSDAQEAAARSEFALFRITQANAATSTASVPASALQGSTVNITVTAKDPDGAALTTGGDTVVVNVTGANTATPTVTDVGDGTYTASYTAANTGSDSVAITLNGVAISGSPYSVTVSALDVAAHRAHLRRAGALLLR